MISNFRNNVLVELPGVFKAARILKASGALPRHRSYCTFTRHRISNGHWAWNTRRR